MLHVHGRSISATEYTPYPATPDDPCYQWMVLRAAVRRPSAAGPRCNPVDHELVGTSPIARSYRGTASASPRRGVGICLGGRQPSMPPPPIERAACCLEFATDPSHEHRTPPVVTSLPTSPPKFGRLRSSRRPGRGATPRAMIWLPQTLPGGNSTHRGSGGGAPVS